MFNSEAERKTSYDDDFQMLLWRSIADCLSGAYKFHSQRSFWLKGIFDKSSHSPVLNICAKKECEQEAIEKLSKPLKDKHKFLAANFVHWFQKQPSELISQFLQDPMDGGKKAALQKALVRDKNDILDVTTVPETPKTYLCRVMHLDPSTSDEKLEEAISNWESALNEYRASLAPSTTATTMSHSR